MRLSKIEKARLQARLDGTKPMPTVNGSLVTLAEKLLGGPLNPTQQDFIFSHDRIGWYVGPAGCAKTSSLVAAVTIPAMLYPGSRWFVGRWTWWTLEQTTLERFLTCWARVSPNLIVDKQAGPPARYWIASAIPGGEPAEIVFHGLDDLEKLGSTEFSGVAVDEANEIDEHMASTLNARLRHKLPSQDRPTGPFFLRMVSNPVRRSHWLHRKFCEESDCDAIPMGKKFKPHPRENIQNLPPNYYENISAGMSPEMRTRFVEGECGSDPSGSPVFPEFRHSMHVGDLKFQVTEPLIRSWDFGRRRPAVLWGQRLRSGAVNRLLCELGQDESLRQFATRIIQITRIAFPMAMSILDFCDPHGTAKRDVAEKSPIEILQEMGINPRYRDTEIKNGLELMSKGLCTLITESQGGARPRSMYDRKGCNLLIEGYASGYHWPTPKPGHALKEKPVADGFYEHLMDCDRYLEVNLALGSTVDHDKHKRVVRKIRSSLTGY